MNRMMSISQSTEVLLDETVQTSNLEALLADTQRRTPVARAAPPTSDLLPRVVVGRIVDIGLSGEPLVQLPTDGDERHWPARSVVAIDRGQIGSEVVLNFENGNREKPIILGLLSPSVATPASTAGTFQVTADEERLELTADREIVLRCGKASITLTRAGKVLIRGAYVLSRSSGANRIKGGSVQIN